MGPIIYNIVFLIIFTVFLALTLPLFLKRKLKTDRINKVLLVVFGVLITFYIRVIVFYNTFLPFGDERVYARILQLKQIGISHPISGLGYVDLITILSKITNISFEKSLVYFAVLLSILGLFVIYIIYKKQTKNATFSALSVIMLLTTSYFIYPLIEARPQQAGMFLTLIGAIVFYNYLENKNKTNLLFFSITYLFVFYYHILSFAILTFIVFFMWLWEVINKKSSYKEAIIPALLFIFSFTLYLIPGFGYERNKLDLIETSKSLWEKVTLNNLWILILLGFLGLALIMTFLKYISSFEKNKNLKTKYFAAVFLVSIFALVLQFMLNKETYFNFYMNSLLYFFIFQISNIFFGIMYLLGIKEILDDSHRQNVFFKYSILLLIFGILILICSIFLDSRLNNLFIRILNYWTLFAAPIAAVSLKKIIKSKISFLSFLITISLINASRNPLFFNYG